MKRSRSTSQKLIQQPQKTAGQVVRELTSSASPQNTACTHSKGKITKRKLTTRRQVEKSANRMVALNQIAQMTREQLIAIALKAPAKGKLLQQLAREALSKTARKRRKVVKAVIIARRRIEKLQSKIELERRREMQITRPPKQKRDVRSTNFNDYMRPMSKEYNMPEYDLE